MHLNVVNALGPSPAQASHLACQCIAGHERFANQAQQLRQHDLELVAVGRSLQGLRAGQHSRTLVLDGMGSKQPPHSLPNM